MKTNDATVLEEPKTHKRATEETIEPAIESRPRATTGVREARIYIDGQFYSEADAKVSDPQSKVTSQQPSYAANEFRSLEPDLMVLVGVCE